MTVNVLILEHRYYVMFDIRQDCLVLTTLFLRQEASPPLAARSFCPYDYRCFLSSLSLIAPNEDTRPDFHAISLYQILYTVTKYLKHYYIRSIPNTV